MNKGAAPVTLYPYALISRHGTPPTLGYYILHEGLIGVFGDKGLQEETYAKIEEKKAADLRRHQRLARLHRQVLGRDAPPRHRGQGPCALLLRALQQHQEAYQTDYLLDAADRSRPAPPARPTRGCSPAPRRSRSSTPTTRELRLNRFDLLIDWGWFYFITKPMFLALDWIYRQVGNFGVAILIITVLVKIIFFPLANKSYASMAKMKAVQPEMAAIRERYGDDKMKQQQAMMELYKKEKINPIAGCLPIVIQIPVFFSLYKVLFITIEMRHAPFFGWIKDLSAPDPTTVFNLFGLIPWDPTVVPMIGPFLHLGVVAAHHGRDHVVADEAQSAAARPDAEDDLRLDADDLHLHAGELLGRPGDLLGLEQHALGAPAEHDHAQARRQDRAVGQPQAGVGRLEEFFQEPLQRRKASAA